MEQKLSRDELVELVKMIQTVRDKEGNTLLEEGHHALVMKFVKAVNHPGGTDLIYYPTLVGLPPEPTSEEIVDFALAGEN
ncbi:MAG: bacteriocin immunity protein [Oscillospiraceae bacterium]|nr:bacteriocin immunity protein [Oscillospiraceae bacterium]